MRHDSDGVLFNRFLYEPEHDRFSFLPYFSNEQTDTSHPAEINLRIPVTGWRDQVWGVSSDGRLSRVSNDGNRTEYGETFLADGTRIHQLFADEDGVTIIAVGNKRLQVWRVVPTEFDAVPKSISSSSSSKAATEAEPTGRRDLKEIRFESRVLSDLAPVSDPPEPNLGLLAPGSKTAWERQRAFHEASSLPVEVRNMAGIRFRLVPPGDYIMGNDRASCSFSMWRGTTKRPVTFSRPLYVSKYEVTQGQWERVMGNNPIRLGPKLPDLPMQEVSWPMCQAFLDRLCQLERVAAGTYRLLSEAEWEYACRAGTDTLYCFGDTVDRTRANVLSPGGEYPLTSFRRPRIPLKTLPVGSYPSNAWGLHDMHGGVSEWCRDRYWWRYPTDPVTDPLPQENGWKRVYRGGNRLNNDVWDSCSYFCDFARVQPETKGRGFGFRIARELPSNVQ